MSEDNVTFLHSGALGDIIYAIPVMKSLAKGKKATLYLNSGVIHLLPEWAGTRHPVLLTEEDIDNLLPLINSQPDLEATTWYHPGPIDYHLDKFREILFDTRYGSIHRYLTYAFPEAAVDFSQPWITKPWRSTDYDQEYKDTIVINRTTRYLNHQINYRFLKNYKNLLFIGTKEEHKAFCQQVQVNHYQPRDFLELAMILGSAKVVIANQSFVFALAEAMKVPRILEVCHKVPNVQPCGKDGFDFIDQAGLETRLRLMVG